MTSRDYLESSVSDRTPSVVFSDRRRKPTAPDLPWARRKPATEAMWAHRSHAYILRIIEASEQPDKNQLDAQEDVGLLGKPVGEQEHEEGESAPEDELGRSRAEVNGKPAAARGHLEHPPPVDV